MSERFDLIVIGGGSAARDAANKAAREHGARVALIEKERWGGSCPNVACSPTKAYLVAAELAHDVNALAPTIGVEAGPARVDLARVYAWKESLKKPQEKWVEELQAKGFATYTGEATLVDAHTVRVGEHVLEADRILIATGSRTAIPPIEGLEEVGWIDHVSALELTELPESLLVVGCGAVGLEFGQIFARFGSKVTIVDAADRIAPASDPDASATLAASLEEEGLELVTSVFVKSVRREDGEIVAVIAPRDGSDDLRGAGGADPARLRPGAQRRRPEPRGGRRRDDQGGDRGGRAPAHLGAGDLGRRRRRRGRAAHAGGAVPGANRRRGHVRRRRTGRGLLGAADRDLHRPGARRGRPDRGAGARAGPRGRDRQQRPRAPLRVHRSQARPLQDRVRPLEPPGARPARRLAQRGRHRPGLSIGLRLGVTVDELAAMHHIFPTFGEGVKAAAEQAAL